MAWFRPDAVAHRRRMFTRHDADRDMPPDAYRYLCPDAERWMSPDELCLAYPDLRERKYGGPSRQSRPPDRLHHDEALLWEIIAIIRDARREIAALKHALVLRRKANFNPNQPRVPAGNPDGGQWTSSVNGASSGSSSDNVLQRTLEASNNESSIEFTSSRRRARGHHYNPQAIFNKYPLPEETRKVFDNATTGPLRDRTSNLNDRMHRLYNQAVDEHFRSFIQRNKIDVGRMTPLQAHQFLNELLDSTDPRIRTFNMRLWMREIRAILRRFPPPRGSE
jgi:hypothetical protein